MPKISKLPAGTVALGPEEIPAVQNGTTVYLTAAQLLGPTGDTERHFESFGADAAYFDGSTFATAGNTNIITDTGGSLFAHATAGMLIAVNGMGAAGGQYLGIISKVDGAGQIRVAPNTTTAQTNVFGQISFDNGAAIIAATNFYNHGRSGTLRFGSGVYGLSKINFTDRQKFSVVFKGAGGVNGSVLMPMANVNAFIDASGSDFMMRGITIGDPTQVATPSFGVVHSITNATPGVDFVDHESVLIEGSFLKAGLYIDRCASSSLRKGSVINVYQGTINAGAATCCTYSNVLNFSSEFAATASGTSNCTDWNFTGWESHSISASGGTTTYPGIWLDGCGQFKYTGGNSSSSGNNLVRITGTCLNVTFDVHTFYADTGPAATYVFDGPGSIDSFVVNNCFLGGSTLISADLLTRTTNFRVEPFAVTQYAPILGGASGKLASSTAGASGEIFAGQSGTNPAWTHNPLLGTPGSVAGQLQIANGNAGGKTVSLLSGATGSDYSVIFPTTAGTAGQALLSNGGATMTFGTLGAAAGGTGVSNNSASTITISGSFGTTFTVTGTTSVTLPTAGTLATLAGSETLTNKTLTTPVINGLPTGTGVATANTVSTLVARDGSGNFSAGTISAALTGNASTAAALATARAIYGNAFDGTAALAQVIASSFGGTGNGFAKLSGPATSEKTFTLPNANAAILTDNAVVTAAQGGTGIANNASSTITISGSFGTTFTVTGTTSITLPTSGTLATLAGSETFTNKTLTSPVMTAPTLGVASATSVSAANFYGGGVTSSFPQFKRSSATWTARLGDDSADATVAFKTQSAGDNATNGATTAFVTAALAAGGALKSKVVSFTYDISTATGSQPITGVGFIPTSIVFMTGIPGTPAFGGGLVDSSKAGKAYAQYGIGGNFEVTAQSVAISVYLPDNSGANHADATITSFDSDGFTLAWVKTGSPTGTATIYALCFR